ncbi:ABC-2 type transport system permease protein [Microcella putealis]|uniref:Transport permease protein n=1 Tax=Microcella putealis TaxID=337005 RepID=A0A4Q7LQ74_9MICO|nr:ABC transporter permease [Microcella putealis]RZS56332.1 ABC-2 type transport system permease protein [Microcella putealis]TQM27182.1 ABC-2 type transport system permease protein [Microcella putealis]
MSAELNATSASVAGAAGAAANRTGATAGGTASTLQPILGSPISRFFSDGWVTTWRNLMKIIRVPEILLFTMIQPIMFVLLFTYVFGAAIEIPGDGYESFLMAGIFAQTVVFGSTYSGSAMAQDLKDGIIDRFRTLPMSGAAVLVGRTNGDLAINALSMVVMMATGFLVGWRVNSSPLEFFAGVALLLLFAYAFSWVMAFLGMAVKSPEVINNASFLILFPLTFISNAFVPTEELPTPLRIFSEWNPVSALVQSARELFGNVPPGAIVGDAWTAQNPFATVLIGVAVMLLVFVPLSIRKFATLSR